MGKARRDGREWQSGRCSRHKQTRTDTDAAQMPDGKQKQMQARTGTKMVRRVFPDSDNQWRLSTFMFPVHHPLSIFSDCGGSFAAVALAL